MADLHHHFPIQAEMPRVFDAVATPAGLDAWWTKRAAGAPAPGAEYQLWFGPEFDWRAVVSRCEPPSVFELHLTKADADWQGTRVGFQLAEQDAMTRVRFHHLGWPAANEHYRTSNFCWAMYLRLLKRWLEHGELVPYERRLDA